MGARARPVQPMRFGEGLTVGRFELPPDTRARDMARVILFDERLTHRYCLIAAGGDPACGIQPDETEYERVKAALEQLAS